MPLSISLYVAEKGIITTCRGYRKNLRRADLVQNEGQKHVANFEGGDCLVYVTQTKVVPIVFFS